MLAAFLTTILFSISVVCANQSARMIGGTEANFWRLLCATILLAVWAHTFGQGLSGDSAVVFFWSGVVGVGADVFLFQALPRLGSRLTLLILQCCSALSAALAEWLWLGTKLTFLQILFGATILAGVVVALGPGKHLTLTRQVFLAGILFSLLAAFGNGFGAVLTRKAFEIAKLARQDVDGATASYQRLIGGLLVAAIALLVVKRREIAKHFLGRAQPETSSREKWRRAWPWVLANSFAGQTLGVTCYQWALKTTPTGIVLPIIATTPLVVIPLAALIEGEPIEPRSVFGGVIAVVGAAGLALAK